MVYLFSIESCWFESERDYGDRVGELFVILVFGESFCGKVGRIKESKVIG